MSRKTIVAALAGLLLAGGAGAPALAGPLVEEEGTSVCLRLDSTSGKRDGVCVFVPVGR
jgi:hypothetical protein